VGFLVEKTTPYYEIRGVLVSGEAQVNMDLEIIARARKFLMPHDEEKARVDESDRTSTSRGTPSSAQPCASC
jgi:hypothetical protein